MALSFSDITPARDWSHSAFKNHLEDWVDSIEATVDQHLNEDLFFRVRDQFGVAEIQVDIFKGDDGDAEAAAEELDQMKDWGRNAIAGALVGRYLDAGWDDVRVDFDMRVIFLLHKHEPLE